MLCGIAGSVKFQLLFAWCAAVIWTVCCSSVECSYDSLAVHMRMQLLLHFKPSRRTSALLKTKEQF